MAYSVPTCARRGQNHQSRLALWPRLVFCQPIDRIRGATKQCVCHTGRITSEDGATLLRRPSNGCRVVGSLVQILCTGLTVFKALAFDESGAPLSLPPLERLQLVLRLALGLGLGLELGLGVRLGSRLGLG